MSNEWLLKEDEISSSLYNGTANAEFAKAFYESFKDKWYNPQNIIKTAQTWLKGVTDFFDDLGKKVQSGINFFNQWMQDDPVGATAGAGAVLLGGAVVLFVGGSAIGAITTAVKAAGGIGAIGSSILSIAKGLKGVASLKGIVTTGITAFGLGSIIRMSVRGVQYLYSFNWNQTDKEIEASQKAAINNLAGIAGQALGSTLGTLVCGTALMEGVKGLKTVRVNPVVLAKLKEISAFDPTTGEVGELYEEALENVKALINSVSRVAVNVTFQEIYKNVRKLIKAAAKGINLEGIFPWLGNLIKNWGEEGSKPWSFALKQEEFIESIQDDTLRNFTEEALESFFESCAESAMIVSYAL